MLLLSDVFALYLKTKNFHWHMSGPHFRDYHLLLDDQGDQIFAMTDAIAERARKIGGVTLRSIGQIARLQRVVDNDAEYVRPIDMLAELLDDNAALTRTMREAHSLCLRERDRRQRDRITLEEVIGDPCGGDATVLAGGYLFLKSRV